MIKIRLFVSILLCFFIAICSYAVQSGKVEYVVPMDYSLIDENQVSTEAEALFNNYLKTDNDTEKIKILNQMLLKYNVLTLINLENPLYFTRLGIIYDKLGNDRYALMNFFRGSNLQDDYPYAFSSFGNYYFSRYDLKKALRLYKKAYDCGFNTDYDTVYHLGVIYEKYGDFTNALKYYKEALAIKNTEELNNKILLLEELLSKNTLYNLDRGYKN